MPAGNTEIVALFTQEEKVSDEVETLFGTDPDKNDTDEDGLSDYVEIYITHTNPLIVDTDENGINDANEDLDGDLLSNIEEVELGTLLNKKDSDSDNLTDYDEIENYKTLPLNEDTDGDGLTDGDEVKLELNPLLDKTDGITLDSNRQIEQEIDQTNIDAELLSIDNQAVPTLVATTSGNINNSIEIKKTDSVEFSDSRALIGEPIDICGEDFTDGQLTFSLDNQVEMLLLDDSDVEYNTYLICHYKNDGTTSFLKTDYDKENNTISAGIDAAGTYFVTDVKALFDELGLSLPKVADLSLLVDKDIELMDVETDDQNSNENIDDSNGELFTTEETIDFENVEVADANAEKITLMAANGAMAQADIIFIIDTTGSMSGEINNVKNNVGYFVDALKEMDCMIMPFILNEIVLAVDPVKLYEYIGLGKCIISVRYPEIERFEDFVYFYEDDSSLLNLVENLKLKGYPPKYNEKMQKDFLRENSWKQRIDEINKVIIAWRKNK